MISNDLDVIQLSPPIPESEHNSDNDPEDLNKKLQEIKKKWQQCDKLLQNMSRDFIKLRINNQSVLKEDDVLDKIRCYIKHNFQKEKKEDKDEDEDEDIFPSKERGNTQYQTNKNYIYIKAEELIFQEQEDFQRHTESIMKNHHPFEKFHAILRDKLKLMENLTAEMFCNCKKVEMNKILAEISLSAEECYLEKKCSEVYNEVIRNFNMLRITHGFPDKPKPNDIIDEVEKKLSTVHRLCYELEKAFDY